MKPGARPPAFASGRAAFRVLLALACSGCGRGPSTPPSDPTPRPAPTAEATTRPPAPPAAARGASAPTEADDPLLDALAQDAPGDDLPGDDLPSDDAPAGDAPDAPSSVAPTPAPDAEAGPPAPPHACVTVGDAPVLVLPGGGPPSIVAVEGDFLVAAHDGGGLRIVRVRPSALPAPVASLALEGVGRPDPSGGRAPPGLARTGAREVTVAAIDGRGRVLEATFDPSLPATAPVVREVEGGGADPRFSPSVRAVGTRRVIAWTDGQQTPMHARLAVLEGARVVSRHDVTQAGAGGAAPTFLEADGPAVLYFLDPHVGLSNLHRVALGADATPGTTEVARPLNLTAEPAALAVVNVGGQPWVAYAAVGNLATRAVGFAPAGAASPPIPMVPGVGYGSPCRLDVARVDGVPVFALEAPTAAAAAAPHEVRLRLVDAAGPGPALALPAPSSDPAIAARADGLLAVAYRAPRGVVVRYVRCAGGPAGAAP